ncbi:MAG: acyltransferase domain-containing protein, partial [Rhodothermales bacterium]
MSKTAFLFPGQGSQYVGMGRDLFASFAEARARFEAADAVLGFSITEMMFAPESDEAEAALKQTDITQPAL